MLGNTPKSLIKRTIAKKVHIEFWNAMENSKKVRDRLTFNPADNTYIKCLSLPLTRVWFRYRARAIPKVKGNYKQSHSDLLAADSSSSSPKVVVCCLLLLSVIKLENCYLNAT